jgi:DNA-binding NarL/FixJ family response regulator
MTSEITNILIADDHPIFRRGVLDIIEENQQFHVIAEVDDGEKALRALNNTQPAIAILDIAMPVIDGLAKTHHWSSRPVFVILTMYDDLSNLRNVLEFGALGYLLKDNTESELINCLQAVRMGKQYISASVSPALDRAPASSPDLLEQLTPTERKILLLIADYKTSHSVAELLSSSIRTVEKHRANICLKLDLHGHNALVEFATREWRFNG